MLRLFARVICIIMVTGVLVCLEKEVTPNPQTMISDAKQEYEYEYSLRISFEFDGFFEIQFPDATNNRKNGAYCVIKFKLFVYGYTYRIENKDGKRTKRYSCQAYGKFMDQEKYTTYIYVNFLVE